MAQKGKKKPSGRSAAREEDVQAGLKAPTEARPERRPEREGARSADWSAAEAGDPDEGMVDVDPALEDEDRAREFGAADNPFADRVPPREDPATGAPGEDEEVDPGASLDRRMTQPPLGDDASGLEEAFGLQPGIVHIVDREDMGKGVQDDPSAYAQGPGKPGLVEGSTPPERPGEGFLDPAARAGQGRTSAEDVLQSRGMAPAGDWFPSGADPAGTRPAPGQFSGAGYLDALLLDHPFPATKESIACALAQEAWQRGGPAEAFHDLVVQLDQGLFQDLPDLKRALGDRFTWESAHGHKHIHPGGRHGG